MILALSIHSFSFSLGHSKGSQFAPVAAPGTAQGGVLNQDSSAAALKHALTERDVCGRRLKRIRFSDDPEAEVGDLLVFETFRDLVDEVG